MLQLIGISKTIKILWQNCSFSKSWNYCLCLLTLRCLPFSILIKFNIYFFVVSYKFGTCCYHMNILFTNCVTEVTIYLDWNHFYCSGGVFAFSLFPELSICKQNKTHMWHEVNIIMNFRVSRLIYLEQINAKSIFITKRLPEKNCWKDSIICSPCW